MYHHNPTMISPVRSSDEVELLGHGVPYVAPYRGGGVRYEGDAQEPQQGKPHQAAVEYSGDIGLYEGT